MIIALRALVKKDLRLFFSDRRSVTMSFVAPIVIGSFFGYIFGGLGGKAEVSPIPVLVADQDKSAISRDIFSRLSEDKALSVKAAGVDEARAAVKKGSASAAVVIPEGFGASAGRALVSSAQRPDMAVLYDPTHAAEKGMIEGMLMGVVMQSVSKEVFSGQTGQSVMDDSIARAEGNTRMTPADRASLVALLKSARQLNPGNGAGAGNPGRGMTVPYQMQEEAVTARAGVRYNGYAHSFGGMGVQFILFMGIDAGGGHAAAAATRVVEKIPRRAALEGSSAGKPGRQCGGDFHAGPAGHFRICASSLRGSDRGAAWQGSWVFVSRFR